jgi:hypothetical protein
MTVMSSAALRELIREFCAAAVARVEFEKYTTPATFETHARRRELYARVVARQSSRETHIYQ